MKDINPTEALRNDEAKDEVGDQSNPNASAGMEGLGGELMGRNPWLKYSRQLVSERADWSRTSEGTAQERTRRLRHLGELVVSLHSNCELTTTNPARMGERDILTLFATLKARGLKPGTMLKYLGIMSQLCAIAGNAIISQMRAHPIKNQMLPHGSGKAGKRSFRLESVLAFLESARTKAETSSDWWDTAAYGVAAFAAGFGVRPKELRALRLADLEKYCWRLRVGFSKTHPDYTTMLPPIQSHIERFLEMRTRYTSADTIFPAIKGRGILNDNEQLSSNQVREMFEEIGKRVGLDIAPKDMRTSYGQVLMDFGAGIETTSRLMRHDSVATTQRWYVDLRPDSGFDKLQDLFAQPQEKLKRPNNMEMYR